MKRFTTVAAIAVVVVLAVGTAAAVAGFSFGSFRDQQLAGHSGQLFGVGKPIAEIVESTDHPGCGTGRSDQARHPGQGAPCRVVTTKGPAVDDQISLWPNSENPTYIIVCNEQGTADPGLVRIELVDRQREHDRHRD